MTYKPGKNHPWRQYPNKIKESEQKKDEETVRSIYQFLKEIVFNWQTYKISPKDFETSAFLKNMSNKRAAQWLISFLKRHYINPSYDR